MKALEGYVLGEVNEPEEKKGVEWRKWSNVYLRGCSAL
jgi:hypothetical protein